MIHKLKKIIYNIKYKGISGLINLWRLYIARKKRPEILKSTPIFLICEISSLCNLKCIYCPKRLNNYAKGKNMDFSLFQKIVDSIPYLEEIVLQGIGEPMLNPELFKMIEYVRNKHIKTQFNTNGTLLNQKNIEKIINSKVDLVSISIDSHIKEKYESVRVGADFEKLISNIKNFVKYKTERKSELPVIGFRAVATKEMLNVLPEFIKFCTDLKIDELIIQDLLDTDGDLDNIKLNKNEYYKLLDIVNNENKLNIILTDFSRFSKHTHNISLCTYPWDGPFITVDGFVTPCCALSDPNVINFGNIKDNFLKEILNNKKYRQFRKDFSYVIPEVCKGCPKY